MAARWRFVADGGGGELGTLRVPSLAGQVVAIIQNPITDVVPPFGSRLSINAEADRDWVDVAPTPSIRRRLPLEGPQSVVERRVGGVTAGQQAQH